VGEFEDGVCRLVVAGGCEIGIRAHGGELFAYENRCLHQGGPVCEGLLVNLVEHVVDGGGEIVERRFAENEVHLVCPWHAYEYDLRTGELVTDRRRKLRRFDVIVRDGEVLVDV
jgi:nitrite reductase/ring-hydroxylating ferredoxin subunit